MVCDIVTQNYPSILDDLHQLEQLRKAVNLDYQSILKDISTLNDSITLLRKQSNIPPYCEEDLYDRVSISF